MPCHQEGKTIEPAGTLQDQDVYHVTGLVNTVSEDGSQVTTDLNCDELTTAYEQSCARSMASFDEFASEVQAEADTAASLAYNPFAAVNESFLDQPFAIRALRIRLCIRWRWISIYIWIKI